MYKLTEVKTPTYHFYKDEDGRYQGEYKDWYVSGQAWEHCFMYNGMRHGEAIIWEEDGVILYHYFYQNNKDITDQVNALVCDINNITPEDKMIIKLKFEIECLC